MIYSIENYLYSLFLAKSTLTIVVALFFTYLGEVVTLGALTVVVMLGLLQLKKNKDAVWFGGTMAVAGIAIYVLKHLFGRLRPEFGFVVEASYSFPSGHAFASAVFFTSIEYVLQDVYPNARKKRIIISGIVLALIGWSRLALGVHWTSDVIVGWILGAILVYISIWINKRITN